MRILEVVSSYESGALMASLIPAIRHLQARDEVTVCCSAGRVSDALIQHAVFPYILPSRMADPRALFRLTSLIKSRHIDVVHAHGSAVAPCCSMAARLAHVPCVATLNDMGYAWQGAQHIVATSQVLQRQLAARGIPAGKITIVHNGIALERCSVMPTAEAKRMAGFNPAIPRAGIFGNMAHVREYLRAWVAVTRQLPHARLLIVGANRSETALRALTQRLHPAAQVEFLPSSTDPHALMQACDVIVNAGADSMTLHAMALARPIIGLQTDEMQEMIGEAGLLMPQHDADALAAAIVRALQDHAWQEHCGTAARQRVATCFDVRHQVEALREVFRRQIHPVPSFSTTQNGLL